MGTFRPARLAEWGRVKFPRLQNRDFLGLTSPNSRRKKKGGGGEESQHEEDLGALERLPLPLRRSSQKDKEANPLGAFSTANHRI